MALRVMREFIKLEASAGIILFAAALFAVLLDNSPWHVYYRTLFSLPVSIQVGMLSLSKPLLLWINDGFISLSTSQISVISGSKPEL